MTGFHQTPGNFRRRASAALVGMLAFVAQIPNAEQSFINAQPQTAQVGTITVTDDTDGATFAFELNGVEISVVAAASSTTTSIASQIVEAINSNGLVRGQVSATSAAAVVTVTSTVPGLPFTLTDSDAKLTTVQAATASAEAAPVKPGRWCVDLGWDLTEIDQGTGQGAQAGVAVLTPQAATWTYTYEAGVVLVATIEVLGQSYTVTHTSATDADTSIAALAAKIEAALPADLIDVDATGAALTLEADTAGIDFKAEVYFGTAPAGAGALVKSDVVGRTLGTSISLGGVAVRRDDNEYALSDGEMVIPPNAGFSMLRQGHIWVEHNGASAPAAGDPVFVYVGATAGDRGKLYASAGTDRIQIDPSKVRWTGLSDRGPLALLYVDALV